MLRIENLSKTYDNGVHALKDVSLEIPRGMFGLLGPGHDVQQQGRRRDVHRARRRTFLVRIELETHKRRGDGARG
jgi:ABC-type Na+ transport system ATPase subunit NatA